MVQTLLRFLWHLPRQTLALGIIGYQKTLSPDHGPLKHLYPYGYCRHEPTCSEYGRRMILERGAVIGSLLTLWRIMRCTPWTKPSLAKIQKIMQK